MLNNCGPKGVLRDYPERNPAYSNLMQADQRRLTVQASLDEILSSLINAEPIRKYPA